MAFKLFGSKKSEQQNKLGEQPKQLGESKQLSEPPKQLGEEPIIDSKNIQIDEDMAILRKPIGNTNIMSSYSSVQSRENTDNFYKTEYEHEQAINDISNGPDSQKMHNFGLKFADNLINKDEREAKEKEEALKVANEMIKQKEEQATEIQKAIEEEKREHEEYIRNLYLPSFEKYMDELNDNYNKWQPIMANIDKYDDDRLMIVDSNAKSFLESLKEKMNDEHFSSVPEFDTQYKNKIKESIEYFEKLDGKALYNLYTRGINYLQNGINSLDKLFSSIGENGISYEGAVKNMSHIDSDISNIQTKYNKTISLLSTEEGAKLRRLMTELINRLTTLKQMSLDSINIHNDQVKNNTEGGQQSSDGGIKM